MVIKMTQAILSEIFIIVCVHCCNFCTSGSLLYRIVSLFYGRFFMEKQVMGEFVRILKLSKTISVPLQLLQTVSILVQNLRNEHAICRLIILQSFPYIITMLMVFNNNIIC